MDGDLGLGSGQTLISRIRVRNNGANILLNDNDDPEALTLSSYFGTGGDGADLTLYLQTLDGLISFPVSGNTGVIGGNFVNFSVPAAHRAFVDGIGTGDRFILALARTAPIPVELSMQARAGNPTATLNLRSIAPQPPQDLSLSARAGNPTARFNLRAIASPPQALSLLARAGNPTASFNLRAVPPPPQELSLSARAGTPSATLNLRALPPPQALSLSARGGDPTARFNLRAVAPIRSLLPHNATPQEVALERATAAPSQVPVEISRLWSADDCPVSLLPWLAWALSVEDWDPAWSEQRKRAAIKVSVSVHRRKGTLRAVREVLEALEVEAGISERPDGAPFTLAIDLLDPASISPTSLAALRPTIERVNRASVHFTIQQEAKILEGGEVYLSGGLAATMVVGSLHLELNY